MRSFGNCSNKDDGDRKARAFCECCGGEWMEGSRYCCICGAGRDDTDWREPDAHMLCLYGPPSIMFSREPDTRMADIDDLVPIERGPRGEMPAPEQKLQSFDCRCPSCRLRWMIYGEDDLAAGKDRRCPYCGYCADASLIV